MSPSSRIPERTGLHVAIIMDGNGRWAERRGWPRNAGHVAGAEAERRRAEWLNDPLGGPEVDVLIRTGGEQRLSDFLLWECAYAELVFTECMWPEFGEAELAEALAEFARRERRFGRVEPATGT